MSHNSCTVEIVIVSLWYWFYFNNSMMDAPGDEVFILKQLVV